MGYLKAMKITFKMDGFGGGLGRASLLISRLKGACQTWFGMERKERN